MNASEHVSPVGFEHDAFVYGSDEEYLGALVPLIGAALDAGDRVFAVVSQRNARLLHEEMGAVAEDVTWIRAEAWYRHPVRTIAAYERTLRELPAGVAALVIGEVQFGDDPDKHTEWTRYEAVLNRVLEPYTARVICPYDSRQLSAAILVDAERTHPNLVESASRCGSDRYVEPEALVRQLAIAVPEPSGPPDLVMGDVGSPRAARLAFVEATLAAGFSAERVGELEVGVSELLTNAIRHGGGTATMSVWLGDTLECIVEDRGAGTDDPLLGFGPPGSGVEGGFGLWCVRQVFDRVELSQSPLGGLRAHASASRSPELATDRAAAG